MAETPLTGQTATATERDPSRYERHLNGEPDELFARAWLRGARTREFSVWLDLTSWDLGVRAERADEFPYNYEIRMGQVARTLTLSVGFGPLTVALRLRGIARTPR